MASRSFFMKPAVLLVFGLLAFAGIVTIAGRIAGGGSADMKTAALTNTEGFETYPAFSPDGSKLAVSVRPAGKKDYDIFVRDLASQAMAPLTSGQGSDIGPAWSPDGRSVAFVRTQDGAVECLIAQPGGNTRRVADCAVLSVEEMTLPAVAWMPDGKALLATVRERSGDGKDAGPAAIAIASLDGGPARRVTQPPDGSQGDTDPVVSPDGARMAFVRSASRESADIFICDLKGGELRQLTFEEHPIGGLAWTANGEALIYAARRMGQMRLWRLPVSGAAPTNLGVVSKNPLYPAVARNGTLAFVESPVRTSVYRVALGGPDAQGEPLIVSNGRETAPAYSPDGKRIANISDASGSDQIWVQDADGANRAQVSRIGSHDWVTRPAWSPDGQQLLFTAHGPNIGGIYVIPAAGGEAKRLLEEGGRPSWSRDGKSIYYESRQQIWKANADGSNARAFTNERRRGVGGALESADGKFVYFRQVDSVWRIPVGGGEAEQVAAGLAISAMQLTPSGFYYREFGRGSQASTVSFYEFATKKSAPVLHEMEGNMDLFCISPDGKVALYPRVDRENTNVSLVKNFR